MFNHRVPKKRRPVSFKVCVDESQQEAVNRVLSWLKLNRFDVVQERWDVVGSQELLSYRILKGNIRANLVFETYQGGTLHTNQEHADIFSEIRLCT